MLVLLWTVLTVCRHSSGEGRQNHHVPRYLSREAGCAISAVLPPEHGTHPICEDNTALTCADFEIQPRNMACAIRPRGLPRPATDTGHVLSAAAFGACIVSNSRSWQWTSTKELLPPFSRPITPPSRLPVPCRWHDEGPESACMLTWQRECAICADVNQLQANTSYLPGSHKSLTWAPEMIMLFWEALQCNKRFRSFIIDTDRAHDFVVLVLYYAIDQRNDPTKQGLVRMCIFVLQTLSVEPQFGKSLNKTFEGQESLPPSIRIPNFHGTYADYLITVGSSHTFPIYANNYSRYTPCSPLERADWMPYILLCLRF